MTDPVRHSFERSKRIGFVLLDGFALMSMAAAVEPLRAANLLAERDLYDLVFLSIDGGVARSTVGGCFDTQPLATAGRNFDLVFVVAGGEPLGFHHAGLSGFLRALSAHGVPLGGISGGSVVLAEAGLMTGRRFTVHWQHFEALRALSDAFLMERRLFVIDRDRYTCAGGAAPLDMMHALVSAHHGAQFARRISDWFIHTQIREANDPQQSGPGARYGLRNGDLVAAVGLMESHLADPLSLRQISGLVGLGDRQLQRLFQNELGQSAMRFYRRIRLEAAKRLLQDTSILLTDIGQVTGFSNPSHFAASFREHFGVSPRQVRFERNQLVKTEGGRNIPVMKGI